MLKRACISVAVLSFLIVLGLPIAQARTNQPMSERSLQKELAESGHAREPEMITIAAELAVR